MGTEGHVNGVMGNGWEESGMLMGRWETGGKRGARQWGDRKWVGTEGHVNGVMGNRWKERGMSMGRWKTGGKRGACQWGDGKWVGRGTC